MHARGVHVQDTTSDGHFRLGGTVSAADAVMPCREINICLLTNIATCHTAHTALKCVHIFNRIRTVTVAFYTEGARVCSGASAGLLSYTCQVCQKADNIQSLITYHSHAAFVRIS
jgi:hypothetical protein